MFNKRRVQSEAVSVPVDAAPPAVETSENDRAMASLGRSQAVIEFTPDGTILRANDNFLSAMGYTAGEIVGEHHRIFVDPLEATSVSYARFWEQLGSGEFQSAQYKRLGKGGTEVWIQATYNPVVDDDGQVYKIVKFATDVTAQKRSQREVQDRTQAVIEFAPDGTILYANDLFLATVGYSLDDLRGKHHRVFMPPGEADTTEYAEFWPSLARGEFLQGEFRRVDRHGRELWLRGAYNPIFGSDGQVVQIMKGVADITDEVKARNEADSVGQSIAQSVSEMTNAIDEIARTVSRTAQLASTAEGSASMASGKVSELDAASETIGRVIDVIQGLSEQTNLLALNATIEAARAGEAGQGFAVVATEVKQLATQTKGAAGDIRTNIEAIQSEIALVVEMIQSINDSVGEVSTEASSVASAIEEQSVVMGQMNHAAERLLATNHAS